MGSFERSTILAHFGDRRTDRPKPASAKQLYPGSSPYRQHQQRIETTHVWTATLTRGMGTTRLGIHNSQVWKEA